MDAVPIHAEPPYVAVIFSSQRTGAGVGPGSADDGYDAASDAMDELAARQPGYVGIEAVRGSDGFGITVSYWLTESDAQAWKAVAEHRAVQELGRTRWYVSYTVRVATVTRSYGFDRAAPAP